MKVLVLAAVVAIVSSSGYDSQTNNAQLLPKTPWQVGKLYKYDVQSHTLARLPESESTGSAYKTQFVIRVTEPGKLQARLENSQYAQVHQNLNQNQLPEDLNYHPIPDLDKQIEISMEGGRVASLILPPGISLDYENILKGLVGSLQIDLSTNRKVHTPNDNDKNENKHTQFRKMETDITGHCETLYTVSPTASDWRRELPNFSNEEDPFEVIKSKSYGNCRHRVEYHFGVPEAAQWTGTAHNTKENQIMKRSTLSRFLIGKNGPIYKGKTTSIVNVNPYLYGLKEAEVHSEINLNLVEYLNDNQPPWIKSEGGHTIKSLLYSFSPKLISVDTATFSEFPETTIPSRVKRTSKLRSIRPINKRTNRKSNPVDASFNPSSPSYSASSVNEIEPDYAVLFLNTQPRSFMKKNPITALRLLQEIAQQLQNPNMPLESFLSKFNILGPLIASMSYGDLLQISRSVEIAKHTDAMKSDTWMIYRDAVTDSGTLPAFQIVKTWIQERKIEGEEAAEVVSNLARTLRNPNKEVMKQFFNLALSPEVKQQLFLNSSALHAATKLINMGQVNNKTAYQYYPTHLYGRFSDQHDDFVVNDILPQLSEELKQFIENGDSHKSQVYIKAIGNLGHREIIKIFSPYLEGKVPVSTYLRTQIIASLRVLAAGRDQYATEVLYSILRNTAEPYEVRVAAILNIFMGQPSDAMMQAMADMTKTDPSIEVRAAIKSSIITVAELQEPRFFELARSAQAVREMVTNEQFGQQYSKTTSLPQYDYNNDIRHLGIWSYIGAEGSLYPRYLRFDWESRNDGWNRESTISAAVSNWEIVSQLFKEFMINDMNQIKPGAEHKYSADKITEIFNLKYKKEPAEASIYVNFMNQQRFFAFGEEDLRQLPKELINQIVYGKNKHYTKVINENQISMMFPVASGMLFMYKFKKPVVIRTISKGLQDNPSNDNINNCSFTSEYSFVYAENHDGCVGFLDTIANKYASVGVVGEFQIYIPMKVHFGIQPGQFKVQFSPLDLEQDTNIVHYRIWPYSTSQGKHTLIAISEDPATKLIERDNKTINLDYKFGQQIGYQFQVNGYSYSNDFRNIINMLRSRDLISHVLSPFHLKDISQTLFNLKYLGKQSKSKSVTFTAAYESLYNQKVEGELSATASDVADASPNSPARKEELVKRVVTGIRDARANVLDLSASFEMPQKLEYVFTSAIGYSAVDPKTQYAVFVGKNSDQYGNIQINAIGNVVRPISSNLNYAQALKNNIKSSFEVDIRSSEKENMHIKGNAERTAQYIDDLTRTETSQKCLEEQVQNNYYQSNCQNMLIIAQAPNSFNFNVSYELSPSVKNVASHVYRVVKILAPIEIVENHEKALPDGTFEMSFDFSYLTRSMNIGFNSSNGAVNINNIAVPTASSHLLSFYEPIEMLERFRNGYSQNQYRPYCVIDGFKIRTFSGRVYNYSLSLNWHLVMHNQAGNSESLVVLARRTSAKSQELYISYRSQNGQNVEIEISPGAQPSKNYDVQVHTDSKKVSEGELTTYWDENTKTPILEYNTAQDGVFLLRIRDNYLKIIYDGERVVVISNEGRDYNRGICGIMSGEPRNDYLTPYGTVDQPEQYAASYALPDSIGDPKTQELQNQAKQMAYQPEIKYTSILKI